jgi:hypothetical protein
MNLAKAILVKLIKLILGMKVVTFDVDAFGVEFVRRERE